MSRTFTPAPKWVMGSKSWPSAPVVPMPPLPSTTKGTTRQNGSWPTKWARRLNRVARAPGPSASTTRVGMTPASTSPPRKLSGK